MNRLFCYGTLQVPQIIRAVTGRTFKARTATLHGYAVYRVKNTEYPGIIRTADSETEGIVYENVSQKDLNVLDLFEGDFYRRQLLDIRLSDGSNSKAWVYVVADNHKDMLAEESWRLEDFMDNGLESFMKGYVNGRRHAYSCKEK